MQIARVHLNGHFRIKKMNQTSPVDNWRYQPDFYLGSLKIKTSISIKKFFSKFKKQKADCLML